ncbi:MAG: hypothetical protein WCJ97_03555 [Phycisphaerae bacterium]
MKYLATILIALTALTLTGCGTSTYPLRIEPVKAKSDFSVEPQITEGLYRVDSDGDVHVLLRAGGDLGNWREQFVLMRIFWRPAGGKTTLDPSALNATFRYVLINDTQVAQYEGAGFVRFSDNPGEEQISARVVDGDLRLTEATQDVKDTLGRSAIRGRFTAKLANAKVMSDALQAQRDYYQRSLEAARRTKAAEETKGK